jgi:chromosome partitioning protein
VDTSRPTPRSAHVIVLGNEKGGSGKSTMAMHIIVALLKSGRRVASIDTDSRQLSLTRYLENRARWARKHGLKLELPTHFSVKAGKGDTVSEAEADEYAAFKAIVDRLGQAFDAVVIDTPANDSFRMRLSHAIADTLVTPINDSFIDLDVLGRVDPHSFAVVGPSHYADLVREGMRDRHLSGNGETDWVVIRNRLATLASRNQAKVVTALKELAALLEFRVADGVSERVIFRELFPSGLTAFDTFDRATLGVRPTTSHVAARQEVSDLVAFLNLPVPAPAADEEEAEPAPLSKAG